MRRIILLIKTILKLPRRLFSASSIFALINESVVHQTAVIQFGSRVHWSEVGKYTYVGSNCYVIHSKIGNFCSIANNVMIGSGRHPLNFISTSPVFYTKVNVLKKCFNEVDFEEYKTTIIGNDVWIGSNAFIKAGVTIGDGAVVGAHSVITKDIEPYSIVAGNPSRFIRKRFDDATIAKLLLLKWWNFSDEILKEKANQFSSVETFLNANA